MKIYLVGGAIRDKLLNLPIKEKDWVVTGTNIKNMLKLGFIKVGKSFPVFIHPLSKEEYSLARTEKKSGFGYKGFICKFSKKVKLIDDLYRRDLTINSIAEDNNGEIIDPFNGRLDIKNKIIKHVSNNFLDDPLRLLRVARFYSYLYHLNFKIKLSTFKLLKKISESKELKYLSLDRIWIETKKAIFTKNPECYFRVIYSCGAIKYIFPEIYNILKIENKFTIKMIFNNYLKNLNLLNDNYIIKFSSILYIFYDFFINNSKYTNIDIFVNKNIKNLSNRFNFPKKIKNIINNLLLYFYLNKNLDKFNLYKIFDIFIILNLNKNIENLNNFMKITFIYYNKKKIFIDKYNKSYTKKEFLKKFFYILNSVSIKNIILDGFKKKNIKKELIKRQKKIIFSKLLNL